MAQQLSTNTFGCAKWVVSSDATQGTHTTIGAALTAASSGDTIFIRPGTYTENLTLKAGVNLVGYAADAYTPNVIILGKATATFAGTCSLAGVQLKTNSSFCLSVTGSSATLVNLKGCFIDANNSTAIEFTSSSGSSKIQLYDCKGDIDTTGIAYFTHSGAGAMKFFGGVFENDGGSTTASTCSGSGSLTFSNVLIDAPITTSSTSSFTAKSSVLNQALIIGGTGTNNISNSFVNGGTSSAISVGTGATLTLSSSTIKSTNTNAVSGLGTIIYSGISFVDTSSLMNTTTQTGQILRSGILRSAVQPVATAVLSATDSNVTGDGTTYTLGSGNVLTVTQQGTALGTTGTFTAPYDGYYLFTMNMTVSGSAAANDGLMQIVVNGTAYNLCRHLPSDTNGTSYNASYIASMSATQTATFKLTISGTTKTLGVQGGAGNGTTLSVMMLC